MPARHDNTPARETSVAVRLIRIVLLMAGIVAVIAAGVAGAVATGAISLPGLGTGSHAEASTGAELADQREAADRQWATATCTNILDWKNEIQRDETNLDLGFGPSARIKDAITATDRLVGELDKLGLPPTAQNAQARVETEQLLSEVKSRLHALEGTASSAESGNILAIGTLVSDLASDRVLGTQVASQLRHVVSVDLGLSLVETRNCRKLVGIPL
jgi:hypothetical protein